MKRDSERENVQQFKRRVGDRRESLDHCVSRCAVKAVKDAEGVC